MRRFLVAEGEMSTVTVSTVSSTSIVGSSGREPINGSSPSRIVIHMSSSTLRSPTCSTSPCAHRRNDVPICGSSGVTPAWSCAVTDARSVTRMRHETPSTTR